MGKIKGIVVVEIVRYLRSLKDRARVAVPEHLQHYLDTLIQSDAWYPEEDYSALLEVAANFFTPPSDIDVWEALGRIAAKTYLDTTYNLLVKKNDPMGTLRHFELLWEMRHDTGRAEIASSVTGKALVKLTDYILVSDKICRAVKGTIFGMMECSGATNIIIVKRQCRIFGADSCSWEVEWDSPTPRDP